jgi:hypothetical protein
MSETKVWGDYLREANVRQVSELLIHQLDIARTHWLGSVGLDKQNAWRHVERLLDAMNEGGVIPEAYYRQNYEMADD